MYYKKKEEEILNRINKSQITFLSFEKQKDMKDVLHLQDQYSKKLQIQELDKIQEKNFKIDTEKALVIVAYKMEKFSNIHIVCKQLPQGNMISHYFVTASVFIVSIKPIFQLHNIEPSFEIPYALLYTKKFLNAYVNVYIQEKSIFYAKYTNERILKDIDYFYETNILTSRLAIVIYKIYKLDFNVSDTKVGKLFAKIYGKSKPYNNKKFAIQNTKGYYLHNIIQCLQIREDIAISIFQTDQNINITQIAKITKLTVLHVQYLLYQSINSRYY